mmetsp:Transcript_788/g.3259  ORF Transcript_788/g.3259 Transcript_788/m.3259 type:complete len:229 (-) Transcript_788:2190-2876(-)
MRGHRRRRAPPSPPRVLQPGRVEAPSQAAGCHGGGHRGAADGGARTPLRRAGSRAGPRWGFQRRRPVRRVRRRCRRLQDRIRVGRIRVGVRRRRAAGHPARRPRAHARGAPGSNQARRGHPAQEGVHRAREAVPDGIVAGYPRLGHEPAVQGGQRGDEQDRGVEAYAAAAVSRVVDAGHHAAQASEGAPVQARGVGQPQGRRVRQGGGVSDEARVPPVSPPAPTPMFV